MIYYMALSQNSGFVAPLERFWEALFLTISFHDLGSHCEGFENSGAGRPRVCDDGWKLNGQLRPEVR